MIKRSLALVALLALMSSPYALGQWGSDLPTAMTQAAQQKKALLLSFGGSDWCNPCILLQSKVLGTSAFQHYAKGKFVLVEVDMPQGDSISPEQKEINHAIVEQYAINTYPTLLVLNSAGIVLGGFKGGTADLKIVTKALDAALANAPAIHAAINKANALSGQKKAEALMEAYQLVPQDLQDYNTIIKDQVSTLDQDDQFGFQAANLQAAEEQAAACFAAQLKQEMTKQLLTRLDKEIQRKDKSKFYQIAIAWEKFNLLLEQCYQQDDDARIIAALTQLKANMQDMEKLDPEAKSLMDDAIDESLADFTAEPPAQAEDAAD